MTGLALGEGSHLRARPEDTHGREEPRRRVGVELAGAREARLERGVLLHREDQRQGELPLPQVGVQALPVTAGSPS